MPQPTRVGADVTDTPKSWCESSRCIAIFITIAIVVAALFIGASFARISILAGELAFVAVNAVTIYILVGQTLRHEDEVRAKMEAAREERMKP